MALSTPGASEARRTRARTSRKPRPASAVISCAPGSSLPETGEKQAISRRGVQGEVCKSPPVAGDTRKTWVEGDERRQRVESPACGDSCTVVGLPRRFNTKSVVLLSTAIGLFFIFFLYRRHRLSFDWPYVQQRISVYSEGSFYFSFYNDIVSAPTWLEGVKRLLVDKRSEHPDVINALHRFNIHQELLVGLAYRSLKSLLGETLFAQLVARTPFNFYVGWVFAIQGFGVAVLCALAAAAGGSAFCCIACFGFFFANYFHRLIVRVQAISLRENWALPFLWVNITSIVLFLQAQSALQRLLLRRSLDQKVRGDAAAFSLATQREFARLKVRERALLWSLFGSSVAVLLFWQFGVFVLTTQASALFAVSLAGFPIERALRRIVVVLMATFSVTFVLQFMLRYLLLSFLPYVLISIWVVLCCRLPSLSPSSKAGAHFSQCSMDNSSWWGALLVRNTLRGMMALGVCFTLRLFLKGLDKDDSHVYQLLLHKLGLFRGSFDTQIYLMGATEFHPFSKYFADLIAPSRVFVFSGISVFVFSLLCLEQLFLLLGLHSRFPDLYQILSEAEAPIATKEQAVTHEGTDPAEKLCDEPVILEKSSIRASAVQPAPAEIELRRRPVTGGAHSGGVEEVHGSRQFWTGENEDAQGELLREHELFARFVYLTPDLCYLCIQAFFFLILMLLVVRLRVLCLPLLSVLAASSVASPPLFRVVRNVLFAAFGRERRCDETQRRSTGFRRLGGALLFTLLAFVPFYLKLPIEELLVQEPMLENAASLSRRRVVEWMQANLPEDAAVLSDIATSAMVRAGTSLRVVVHPQFEDVKMRKRVQFSYGVSACPPEELYATLLRDVYESEYLLISNFRCAVPRDAAVNAFQLGDMVEETSFHCPGDVEPLQRFCFRSQLGSSFFDMIYRNGQFALLRTRLKPERLAGCGEGSKPEEQPEKTGNGRCPKGETEAAAPAKNRTEIKRQLLEELRSVDVERKNEVYRRFNWRQKTSTLAGYEPWLQRCVRDDSHCGEDIQEYARELTDMYGLHQTTTLLQNRAIQLFPKTPSVSFAYAVFLDFDLGRKKEALSYYTRGVDGDPSNIGRVVQFVLYLEETFGRSLALQATDRLLHLDASLAQKTHAELLPEAANLCRAALLLREVVVSQATPGTSTSRVRDLPEIQRVMRRFWSKSKELNVQSGCVVDSWPYM
ncbi:q-cell neuroblast polarization, partial [Cystoisospora suis]